MKYAIKIRSIIWRKISIYSVQGLPVGSNNVGFDVIGASPEECYGYAVVLEYKHRHEMLNKLYL